MRSFVFSAALALLGACAHAPGPTASHAAPTPLDPLKHLNQVFREDYAWQRQEMLRAKGEPWIWVLGDQLTLFYDGKRLEGSGIPARYHVLKAFSHVPLAVYVILATDVDEPLGTEALRRASDFRAEIVALRANVDSYPLTDKERTRARTMLDDADGFLEHALQKQRVEAEELHLFTRHQRQPVMANVTAAARAQIESLDAQVRRWRKFLGPRQWDRVRIVISAPATPRARNLVTQYFAHALHEKGEGRRIVYAENQFAESVVRDHFGTDLLDSAIGEAFFDDERRMHRDLLSDAATDILKDFDFAEPR